MTTFLLSGATGFLGSHLLKSLLGGGGSVVIVKRTTSDLRRIAHLLDRVKVYDVDSQSVEDAFRDQKIDTVIHTACQYGRNQEQSHQLVESNLVFGLKLLDCAISYRAQSFLNADTLLQKKLNPYALSKAQFVEWLRMKSDSIQVVNLKIEHMFGPGDDENKFVSWLIGKLEQGVEKIELTSGVQERDFVYIDDVVSAFLIVMEKLDQPGYHEFEIGTGKSVPVRSLVEAIKELYESSFGKIGTILEFGSIPYRDGEMMSVKVNTAPLKELGWFPRVSMRSGVFEVLRQRNV